MSRIQQNTESTNPAPLFTLQNKLLPLRRPPTQNGQILRRTQKRLKLAGRQPSTFFAEIRERQLTASDEATPTKLSILQKKILLIALRWRYKAHADVYTEDIKVEAFGWQAMHRYWDGWQPSIIVQPATARLHKDHPSLPNWCCHGQIFDRQSIGESRYNTVSASVSRALKRLAKRHLIFRSGAGWSLTDQGLDVARTFVSKPGVVNKVACLPNCERNSLVIEKRRYVRKNI